MDFEYEGVRRLVYGDGATFVPVCMTCNRFVKADEKIEFSTWDGSLKKGPNAKCAKCGRTEMLFEGFY
jgi:hypothetical protein